MATSRVFKVGLDFFMNFACHAFASGHIVATGCDQLTPKQRRAHLPDIEKVAYFLDRGQDEYWTLFRK